MEVETSRDLGDRKRGREYGSFADCQVLEGVVSEGVYSRWMSNRLSLSCGTIF